MDARRAAAQLDVPFYVWDLSATFADAVIDDFLAEYEAGRTPNPCVRCNQSIKFAALLDRALALGFDAVATGHYARLEQADAGPKLRRAVDSAKDQSYVLGVLTSEQLRHCLFPLGESHKSEVRQEAERLGLPVAGKPDSHDICFIPDGDTAGFLTRNLGVREGDIRDAQTGEVLGKHRGTHTVTVGQRKGLGLTRSAPDRSPRYVVGVDPGSNTVLVGTAGLLSVDAIDGVAATWAVDPAPAEGTQMDVSVQIRAHADPVPALLRVAEQVADVPEVVVHLTDPLRGVAPGQSMVFYLGDQVIGQATIARTWRTSVTATG